MFAAPPAIISPQLVFYRSRSRLQMVVSGGSLSNSLEPMQRAAQGRYPPPDLNHHLLCSYNTQDVWNEKIFLLSTPIKVVAESTRPRRQTITTFPFRQ